MPVRNQIFIDLSHYQLWDFAGVDGLQFALLLSDAARKIAPFQSTEITFLGYPCSLLRLCGGNFRLGFENNPTLEQTIQQVPPDLRVWVKRCDSMKAIALTESASLDLLSVAVTKPPHRLQGLQPNCAVPARIDGISVLVWRHQLLGQPIFELQMAMGDADIVRAKLAI